MKKIRAKTMLFGSIGLLMTLGLLGSSAAAAQPPSDLELARYHAPIHYQDTDSTKYKGDYITKFNYDNDWRGENNWDNLSKFPLKAYGYYSVVETCTHNFILYTFFHPQDWIDSSFGQEHENDMEGLLTIVRKDGSTFGKLEGIVTVFHKDFYSYTPPGSPLKNGAEDIDGTLTMQSYTDSLHPLTAQEAKGHGLKAWPFIKDFTGGSNQDGIIYFPSRTTAEEPSSGNDRNVKYQLIDLFAPGGLWERQLQEAPLSEATASTYLKWGKFKGDKSGGCGSGLFRTCEQNGADAPWGWDDHDDGSVHTGEMALDPAHLVEVYFKGLGNFDRKYIRNRYISDLKAKGYGPGKVPRGWDNKLNIGELFNKQKTQCP
ncbi:MAG TPA: hypothetical protein V6D14_26005 [Coleofasciculaceae cyanobacterium]|jgi:hypothetical protein